MPGPMQAVLPRHRYAASMDTASAPHTGQGGRSAGPALEAREEALTLGPAAQGEEGEAIMGEVKQENTKLQSPH